MLIKKWKLGSRSERIELGNYTTDSSDYVVITEFSLIPVADGLRGKSMLYLITNEADTFSYRADIRVELPIDLYKNHFVFKKGDNKYIFLKPELIDETIICFGGSDNKDLNW